MATTSGHSGAGHALNAVTGHPPAVCPLEPVTPETADISCVVVWGRGHSLFLFIVLNDSVHGMLLTSPLVVLMLFV